MSEQGGMSPKEIIVYSTTWCPDCKRAKRFLGEQRVSYTNIDVEQDPEAMARVEAINRGMRSIPTMAFPGARRPGHRDGRAGRPAAMPVADGSSHAVGNRRPRPGKRLLSGGPGTSILR